MHWQVTNERLSQKNICKWVGAAVLITPIFFFWYWFSRTEVIAKQNALLLCQWPKLKFFLTIFATGPPAQLQHGNGEAPTAAQVNHNSLTEDLELTESGQAQSFIVVMYRFSSTSARISRTRWKVPKIFRLVEEDLSQEFGILLLHQLITFTRSFLLYWSSHLGAQPQLGQLMVRYATY